MDAVLIASTEIAPGVRHFVLEADGVERLDFLPGQFVSFTQSVEGKPITRAYSLAAAPAGTSRFELCLNRVDGGHLSPQLFAMQPGDRIGMRPPLGTFVLRQPPRDSVMIATGTGIAPFRAMLQAHLATDSPAFTLLFGVRYEPNLLYRQEFEALERKFPHFRFLPTLSRPDADWKGRTGHVQGHLEEAIAGRRDLDIYLCGLKEMVDDVRSIVKGMGFDRKQIRYEKYD
jgi:CDP-4-dehydro-6-deoxyglucose reductase